MESFISWKGGKKLLRRRIVAEFPESFGRYIDVFGGAGWVLFAKDRHAPFEVFNDLNGDLINLYRIVKYHPEALQKELEYTLISGEQFFDARDQIEGRGLTDIQRAARFFVVIKESFGNDRESFCCVNREMEKRIGYLAEVRRRLKNVVIERQDFAKILKTYDRPDALFYLDPPYYNAEGYYGEMFAPEDHIRLRDSLQKIKGKFVLSYNDCPEVRELYAGYPVLEVERQNNLTTKSGSRKYRELLIKNY